ncbi:PepSY-like domain-containing protein [Mucilaginibacter sp. NFR10]|uniref:PepSY-like domain-containing protein n=1 Tax=Mucilaginibacter sp. NFR10 TaxID=1566292 RepID=UPI000871A477|nr:PepSY-like domain-containing protein [Mucilaginibacter sp. NFR10]SCW56229.1 Putative beta-lactamase-inhibitor-like, PepSY-like [Mucilaginibacter sp. NFR10]
MKKPILLIITAALLGTGAVVKATGSLEVPVAVKQSLAKKYPNATKVTWEKEKGNYEANWGGKSGEDTSVTFTPKGEFVEEGDAIPVNQLPPAVFEYVKTNYKGTKIKEAGRVTNAAGKKMFEAEIKGKDLLFDQKGKFIKID